MSFTSFNFVFFFSAIFIAYWGLPHRYRYLFLLAASYYFYGSAGGYCVAALSVLTLIHYVLGIWIEKTQGKPKTACLISGWASVLLMLYAFKYHAAVTNWLGGFIHIPAGDPNFLNFQWILPIGISFYALQSLGYLMDVYRKDIKAERHLGYFALYVSFFPQLVAGPIERSRELLPQFFSPKKFDYSHCVIGLRLVLWGFFKKLIVADRIAVAVDLVYQNPSLYNGSTLLVATYLFAFQIYFDFSAYTDIARGCAKLLGFELRQNFKQPYYATSMIAFWRRWHISLSTWFRDYVYIPMGGNRVGKAAFARNILIVFGLSGLWHGAGANFAFWGVLHGMLVILNRSFIDMKSKHSVFFEKYEKSPIQCILSGMLTFHLIVLTWIFFRCPSVSQGFDMIGAIFIGMDSFRPYLPGLGVLDIVLVLAGIIAVMTVDFFQEMDPAINRLDRNPRWGRWGIYTAMLWLIMLFGWNEPYQFIYFVF